VIGFGVLIIFTGVKMLFPQKDVADLDRNLVIRGLNKIMPVSSKFDGQKFFTRIDGKLAATPLLVALIVLEFSDIVFAVDSVPAIFGIIREPLIVFTSNICAI
jgi:tellurite resistance protein TerC